MSLEAAMGVARSIDAGDNFDVAAPVLADAIEDAGATRQAEVIRKLACSALLRETSLRVFAAMCSSGQLSSSRKWSEDMDNAIMVARRLIEECQK